VQVDSLEGLPVGASLDLHGVHFDFVRIDFCVLLLHLLEVLFVQTHEIGEFFPGTGGQSQLLDEFGVLVEE